MKFYLSRTRTVLAVLCVTFFVFLSPQTRVLAQGSLVIVSPEQIKAYSTEQVNPSSYAVEDQASSYPRSKSHAPEPPTMILFLSGAVGLIIRFAQKSFRAFKRALDRVLSLILIILSLPLLLLIAFLVRVTSKGPVIYRQERVGKDGNNFTMLKFRTMSQDAEKGTGAVWARQNDPRVTPVGGILRQTHLDELPQLFNVLIGEMSIVGPRPERPEIVKSLKGTIKDYEKRLQVLPGITGMAQVFHRYDVTIADVRKKVKYDLLYIKKMCWLVEMRILALTCVVILTGKAVR